MKSSSNAMDKCNDVVTCVHSVRLKDHCAECPQQTVETTPKTEPFAELARKRFKKLQDAAWKSAPLMCRDSASFGAGFKAGWQAALPTPEQYAHAARQIAEELHNFNLTSILGQPGGKQ